MKINNGKITPCAPCYRARQRVKDLAAMVTGGVGVRTQIETTVVTLTVENTGRTITEVSNDDFAAYIGRKIYVAGRKIIDVDEAAQIKALGTIVKTIRIN